MVDYLMMHLGQDTLSINAHYNGRISVGPMNVKMKIFQNLKYNYNYYLLDPL